MRYIDLVYWINNNAHKDDCDEETLYKYLYALIYMLASKGKYFHRKEYYDGFALYATANIHMRLKHPTQLKKNGEEKSIKIDNILDYLKKTLPFQKINYQNQEFYQGYIKKEIIDSKLNKYSEDDVVTTPLYDRIEDYISDFRYVESKEAIESIPESIKKYFKNISTEKDENVYISCLLTLINYFRDKYEKTSRLSKVKQRKIIPNYYRETTIDKDTVVLYHLDDSYVDYIAVMCRILKNDVSKELRNVLSSELPPEYVIRAMAYNGIEEMITTSGIQND